MKYFFYSIFLFYLSQSEIFAQDLLIVNKKDSIPCRIKNIDGDSSVYYKAIYKYDHYLGYLKRDYYSEIIIDYYTNLKRYYNPNNGLGFVGIGMQFTHIPLNPILDIFIDNENLLNDLSNGYSFSLSFQKFYNPIATYFGSTRSYTNLSVGLSFGYYSQKADSSSTNNLKRQVKMFSLLISYNTKFKYTTYITFKPGLMFNTYSGYYNIPVKSRSTIFNIGIGISQKLFDITKKFALFLTTDQYLFAVKSGKIDYERLNYNNRIFYNNWQYDYGFSVGFALKYFY
jgi:hypothetical protein